MMKRQFASIINIKICKRITQITFYTPLRCALRW